MILSEDLFGAVTTTYQIGDPGAISPVLYRDEHPLPATLQFKQNRPGSSSQAA